MEKCPCVKMLACMGGDILFVASGNLLLGFYCQLTGMALGAPSHVVALNSFSGLNFSCMGAGVLCVLAFCKKLDRSSPLMSSVGWKTWAYVQQMVKGGMPSAH